MGMRLEGEMDVKSAWKVPATEPANAAWVDSLDLGADFGSTVAKKPYATGVQKNCSIRRKGWQNRVFLQLR